MVSREGKGREKKMLGRQQEGKLRQHRLFVSVIAALVVLALAMVCLTGCSGGSEKSSSSDSAAGTEYEGLEPVTLILADCASPGSSGNLLSDQFAAKVNEKTSGKITVDYHGNSELGGDVDLLRQEQSGDIDMVTVQPAPMVSFVPELAVFDLPMLFATAEPDDIESVLNGENEFTDDLQKAYNAVGYQNLGFLQNATFRETTSNKALNSLSDFKGFQIRTMENSNHMAFWQALGAEPTPLAFSEVYFALQNGTVDGQENANDTTVGASLQEVQKYLCKTNHILYTYGISMNKDKWDSLDPAYQKAIEESLDEVRADLRGQLDSLDSDNEQAMVNAGVEVIEYDQSFFDEVLKLEGVQKLYSDISSQTNGLSDTLISALAKAES